MSKLFAGAQNLGKSFMLPIAVLPAAGLLLGIGGVFTNPVTLTTYPMLDNALFQAVFTVMKLCGSVVFDNLALLFAVGIAVGMARSDKGTAGLAAVLCYIVMNKAINASLLLSGTLASENLAAAGQANVLGIVSLQTGVMGGIMGGLLAWWVQKRFGKTALPDLLAFFSGSRLVPIVSSFFAIFLGVALFLSGRIFRRVLATSVVWWKNRLYRDIVLRHDPEMSDPTGSAPSFLSTVLADQRGWRGGSEWSGGAGDAENFAQLADPTVTQYYIGVSRFMAGRFADFMFGLPGAALAIYHSSRPENRKKSPA
jgi:PTS system maltose and glucose-specific IIC component